MSSGFAPEPRTRFRDRRAAGRALGAELGSLESEHPIVVALPSGGVPVGVEVAAALGAPLDITLVRKLGAPGNPELGVGALAEDERPLLDTATIRRLHVGRADLDSVLERERDELRRRRRLLRERRARIDVAGRLVLLDKALTRAEKTLEKQIDADAKELERELAAAEKEPAAR